jgi:hypothetical protein
MLTSKALAYLNAKKSNLKVYEEQINPNKSSSNLGGT